MPDARTPPSEGIAVQGVGRAMAAPDSLSMQLGAHVLAPTVGAALDGASADSDALLQILGEFGVSPEMIRTGRMAIHPQWHYTGAEQQLVGYQVAIDHSITVTSTDRAGAIITAAAEQLGNSLSVGGLNWTIDDPDEALADARTAAWRDATNKGRQLAELAGRSLGAAVWIREGGPQPTPFAAAARAEMASGPTIEPGQSELEVHLDVVFSVSDV